MILNITSNVTDAVSNISTDNCTTVGYIFYLNNVEVDDTATTVYQYTSLIPDTSYEMYNKVYDVDNNLSNKSNSQFITTTLSLEDNELIKFNLYPNPTNNILNIESKTAITKIEVYNKLEQLVLENINNNTINIANLSQDIYFVKVTDSNGNFGIKKVVKK